MSQHIVALGMYKGSLISVGLLYYLKSDNDKNVVLI